MRPRSAQPLHDLGALRRSLDHPERFFTGIHDRRAGDEHARTERRDRIADAEAARRPVHDSVPRRPRRRLRARPRPRPARGRPAQQPARAALETKAARRRVGRGAHAEIALDLDQPRSRRPIRKYPERDVVRAAEQNSRRTPHRQPTAPRAPLGPRDRRPPASTRYTESAEEPSATRRPPETKASATTSSPDAARGARRCESEATPRPQRRA